MSYGHNKTTKNKKSWQIKESKTRPETNNRERVDFNPEAFDRAIQQKGVVAKVYRTTYCPKVKSVDGAEHEIDCTLCNGSGFLDLDPICINVLIKTQELDKLPNIEGFVDGNTVIMSFPIGVEIQYFTKVELEDFSMIFFQRVLRAKGQLTDVLKYRAWRVNVLIDYNNKRYFQDTDFAIDPNGNIKWLTPGDQQLVAFSKVPDSGTWKLRFGSTLTSPLPFDANASTVQAALRAIPGAENVTVVGDYATGFTVTMIGVDVPVSLMTSVSALPDVVAVQRVAASNINQGSYQLQYNGVASTPIDNDGPDTMQTALRTIPGLENVTVTQSPASFTYDITFTGVAGPAPLLVVTNNTAQDDNGPMTITVSDVTIGTAVTIGVTDKSVVASKPNDSVPYTIHYQCAAQYRARAAAHSNRYTQYVPQGQFSAQGQVEHIKLPEEWYFTKEFFAKRLDFDGNETEQGPYDAHKIVTESGGDESN